MSGRLVVLKNLIGELYKMQMHEAEALSRRWNNKPCNHPHVEKEYHFGSDTGDYVCTTCGQAGWGRHWPAEERKEHQEPPTQQQ